jgi:hypothetical protein
MTASPVLVLHIASGTLGVLAGFIAVFLRKGSRRHGRAGSLFVLAMMSLGLSGIYLALRKSQITNVLGGSLAFYLVGTAWLTVRRKIWKSGFLDWAGLLLILAVGTTEVTFGLQALLSPTGLKYDYPPAPYFIFGAVALLAAAGDLRLLIRGAISASPRLARHLWRMCFALFIASASIFLARPQLFPAFLRKTGILALLSFLPLILLIFWMLRVRFARAYSSTRQHDGKPNGKVMNTQEGHEFLLVP